MHSTGCASPLGGIVEAAKLPARVAGQRVDQNLLRSAVGDPGRGRAGLAGKAAGLPQHLPVRRPVARPSEAAGIDERFCDQDRVPMHCVEVAREPAKAQPQHPRSEVRRGAPGQDEEPRVVGNQMKAAKLLLGQPPDPAVAGLELERAGVPAHEREPVLAEHCDVAHASPDQAPEGQIVVRAHQRIPPDPLASAHRRADRHLAQPLGNQLEHRLRRGRWACAPLWRPRRHLSRDPVSPIASISYRPGKIGPADSIARYMNADYYQTMQRLTKGQLGRDHLLERIAEADPATLRRKGKQSFSESDTVKSLEGGSVWYGHLSRYFQHGELDGLRGRSYFGGVTSSNIVEDEWVFAVFLEHLVHQMFVMVAHGSLSPTTRVETDPYLQKVFALLAERRAATDRYRKALTSLARPGDAAVPD